MPPGLLQGVVQGLPAVLVAHHAPDVLDRVVKLHALARHPESFLEACRAFVRVPLRQLTEPLVEHAAPVPGVRLESPAVHEGRAIVIRLLAQEVAQGVQGVDVGGLEQNSGLQLRPRPRHVLELQQRAPEVAPCVGVFRLDVERVAESLLARLELPQPEQGRAQKLEGPVVRGVEDGGLAVVLEGAHEHALPLQGDANVHVAHRQQRLVRPGIRATQRAIEAALGL
mmetsp:Transcript_39382/g.125669  ORF Transcript_39382/g.125669 Transcript_39382/m.125669 type:complete len:226 (+) Transcript_39382:1001-1678(+)